MNVNDQKYEMRCATPSRHPWPARARRACMPFLAASIALSLNACTVPGTVRPPDKATLEKRDISSQQLPPAVVRVYAGDTLRIVRDSQLPLRPEEVPLTQFSVRQDGSFAYPEVGKIEAAGRTPEEIADDLTQRLTGIYKAPHVTVNIAEAPGNRVMVGGAVKTPNASFDLAGIATAQQAIIAAGGLLSGADPKHVALARLDDKKNYQVYFFDYTGLITPQDSGTKSIALQRGDILFVPKSRIGEMVDGMDLYVTQLLPFFHGIGVSANYQINQTSTPIQRVGPGVP